MSLSLAGPDSVLTTILYRKVGQSLVSSLGWSQPNLLDRLELGNVPAAPAAQPTQAACSKKCIPHFTKTKKLL